MNGTGNRVGLALAVTLGLAACADAPRTMVTSKAPDTRQFVTTSFPLWIEVRGKPYGDQGEGAAATITGAMKEAYVWNPAAAFTTDPGQAPGRTPKVVMTFNGAAGIGGRDQCQDRSQGGGALPDGRVGVVATLCSQGDALANVRGQIATTTGADDPRFAALIRQITTDMFRTDFDGDRPRFGISGGGMGVGIGF